MSKILTASMTAVALLSVVMPTAASACIRTPQGPKKPDAPQCEQPFAGSDITLDVIRSNGNLAAR